MPLQTYLVALISVHHVRVSISHFYLKRYQMTERNMIWSHLPKDRISLQHQDHFRRCSMSMLAVLMVAVSCDTVECMAIVVDIDSTISDPICVPKCTVRPLQQSTHRTTFYFLNSMRNKTKNKIVSLDAADWVAPRCIHLSANKCVTCMCRRRCISQFSYFFALPHIIWPTHWHKAIYTHREWERVIDNGEQHRIEIEFEIRSKCLEKSTSMAIYVYITYMQMWNMVIVTRGNVCFCARAREHSIAQNKFIKIE